jgi:hypothetical protein
MRFLVLLILVGLVWAQKPGLCPPPVGVGICAITCLSDLQCLGIRKCCRNACGGTSCMHPI